MDLLLPLARLTVLISFSAIFYWLGRSRRTSKVVLLVPVCEGSDPTSGAKGLLAVPTAGRRSPGPALPSGDLSRDESWQEAAVRVLFETTGIAIHSSGLVLIDIVNMPNGGSAICCETSTLIDPHKSRVADDRIYELAIVRDAQEIASPEQRRLAEAWLAASGGSRARVTAPARP